MKTTVLLALSALTAFGCSKQPEGASTSTPTSGSAPVSPAPAPTPMAATTPSTVVPATTPIATTVMAVPAATEAGGKTAPPGSNAKGCGSNTSDWCAAPAGDACGVHKNVAACKADKKCKGMKYTGESLVACKDDGTGFTSNCPTVGCISR